MLISYRHTPWSQRPVELELHPLLQLDESYKRAFRKEESFALARAGLVDAGAVFAPGPADGRVTVAIGPR